MEDFFNSLQSHLTANPYAFERSLAAFARSNCPSIALFESLLIKTQTFIAENSLSSLAAFPLFAEKFADADFDDLPPLFSLFKAHFETPGFFQSRSSKNGIFPENGEVIEAATAEFFENRVGDVVSGVLSRLPPGQNSEFRGEVILFFFRVLMAFSAGCDDYDYGGRCGVGSVFCVNESERKKKIDSLLRNSKFVGFDKDILLLQKYAADPSALSHASSFEEFCAIINRILGTTELKWPSAAQKIPPPNHLLTFADEIQSDPGLFRPSLRLGRNAVVLLFETLILLSFAKSVQTSVKNHIAITELIDRVKLKLFAINPEMTGLALKIIGEDAIWAKWPLKARFATTVSLEKAKNAKIDKISKTGNKNAETRAADEYLFRSWPKHTPAYDIAMGNLVLETVLKDKPSFRSDRKKMGFEQAYRRAGRLHCRDLAAAKSLLAPIKATQFSRGGMALLPDGDAECERFSALLREAGREEDLPAVLRFRLLRLLRERDFKAFHESRGKLSAVAVGRGDVLLLD